MTTIFGYELRRLLRNRLYWVLLIATFLYGRLILTAVTLHGVSHTAPFSPWSFGDYMARLTPLLCLGEMALLASLFSGQAARANALLRATPIHWAHYTRVRCYAVLTATLFLCLFAAGTALVFLKRLFGVVSAADWLAPGLLASFPPLFLCLGVALFTTGVHPAGPFAAMLLPVVLTLLPSDLSMGQFFTRQPRVLQMLDPTFQVPFHTLGLRLLYTALGAGLFVVGSGKTKNIHKRQTNERTTKHLKP